MPDYIHGVKVTEVMDGARPIRTASTSIIGLVATADDADAAVFPLNQAVLVTDLASAVSDAGTTGTLAGVLSDISVQAAAIAVIVRVAEDADPDAQDTNVIGGDVAGTKTGLQALLSAESKLGVKPRILGAPGLDRLAVATELASIAQKLKGMTYVHANGATTKEDAVTYRGNFSQREIEVIWPSFTSRNVIAVALGLRAKIDQETGWHKTISNVGINGVTGIDADVSWDLSGTAHDAHYLNSNDVTTLINKNGYRFWGNRTCSNDPLFAFEVSTRTAQVLSDTIGDALMWANDKPMSPNLIKDIVESVKTKLRSLVAEGLLIDADAWYDPNENGVDVASQGQLVISYDYQEVLPLEGLHLNQRKNSTYLVNLGAS